MTSEGRVAYSTGQLYDMWLRVADGKKRCIAGRPGSGSASVKVEERGTGDGGLSVAPATPGVKGKARQDAGRSAGSESSLLRELRVAYIASLDRAKHGVHSELSKKAWNRARAHSKPLHMIDAGRPGKEPASTFRR